MKTAGIVGGIGPDSTVEYYRAIIGTFRRLHPDGSYPSLVINSIDVNKLLGLVAANRLEELTRYLGSAIEALARAGADFAALAANTPHIVFPALARRAPIPLVSIVEAACAAARERSFRRAAVIGTRFTMQASFYADVFAAAGIDVVRPADEEQAAIHAIYAGELLNGIFREESASRVRTFIARLRSEERIDCVVLAGTELPLLLPEAQYEGVPVLDTTKEHVRQIVRRLAA